MDIQNQINSQKQVDLIRSEIEPSDYSGRSQTSSQMRQNYKNIQDRVENIENSLNTTQAQVRSIAAFIEQMKADNAKAIGGLKKQNQAILSMLQRQDAQRKQEQARRVPPPRRQPGQDLEVESSSQAVMHQRSRSRDRSRGSEICRRRVQVQRKRDFVGLIRGRQRTPEQVAELTGVHLRTISRWLKNY